MSGLHLLSNCIWNWKEKLNYWCHKRRTWRNLNNKLPKTISTRAIFPWIMKISCEGYTMSLFLYDQLWESLQQVIAPIKTDDFLIRSLLYSPKKYTTRLDDTRIFEKPFFAVSTRKNLWRKERTRLAWNKTPASLCACMQFFLVLFANVSLSSDSDEWFFFSLFDSCESFRQWSGRKNYHL